MDHERIMTTLFKQIEMLEEVNNELKVDTERFAAEIRNNALAINELAETLRCFM